MSHQATDYEFTEEQNNQVLELVSSIEKFRRPLLSFALIMFVGAVWLYQHQNPFWGATFYSFTALFGAVALVFSALSKRLADDLRRIVDTEGSDIDHLMEALVKMRKSFTLGAALVFTILACLLGLLFQTLVVARTL